MLSAVGVIPARYTSSRLPGKPLADLQGKPLIYHVYHRAQLARSLDKVFVATDDERIAEVATQFGATALMTGRHHRSGTDRIAEAVESIEAQIVVNIQGDEPLIDVSSIDLAVDLLKGDSQAQMSTLKCPLVSVDELFDPHLVKVVTDRQDYALYFSRGAIPYVLSKDSKTMQQNLRDNADLLQYFFGHIGLYAFRRDFLMQFARWSPSPLEKLEDLEQLRALEHGVKIKVGKVSRGAIGVDTPEDLERIRRAVNLDPDLLKA